MICTHVGNMIAQVARSILVSSLKNPKAYRLVALQVHELQIRTVGINTIRNNTALSCHKGITVCVHIDNPQTNSDWEGGPYVMIGPWTEAHLVILNRAAPRIARLWGWRPRAFVAIKGLCAPLNYQNLLVCRVPIVSYRASIIARIILVSEMPEALGSC